MTIRFASLNDVREFVNLATLQSYPVEVVEGERSVNAKSFMELFTLDFARPLSVEISGEENRNAFAKAAKKFIL